MFANVHVLKRIRQSLNSEWTISAALAQCVAFSDALITAVQIIDKYLLRARGVFIEKKFNIPVIYNSYLNRLKQ